MNQIFAGIKFPWTRKGKHSKHADCVLILAHSTPQINSLDHLNIVQIFLFVLAHLRSHLNLCHAMRTSLAQSYRPKFRLANVPSEAHTGPRFSVISDGVIQSIRTSG